MLVKFRVANFRNFKDEVSIDFTNIAGYQFNSECITNHLISKMIIYGRNSTGKTNLGLAITDIKRCLSSNGIWCRNDEFLLNADSQSEFADFSYTFRFNNHELTYHYRRQDSCELYDEELFLDGQHVFYCNFGNHKVELYGLQLLDVETVNIDRYLEVLNSSDEVEESTQVPPFLRWLISNAVLGVDSPLLALSKYVRHMRMNTTNRSPSLMRSMYASSWYDRLSDPKQLDDFQRFLNAMGVECQLVCEEMPDGHNQLYFKHEKLIPFAETASSGTLAIADLYARLQFDKSCSFIFMDEFDAFYHYEMSEKVVEYVKAMRPDCQIIFTTHNTNLMSNSLLRPDCLFILSGQGTLTQLCNATSRELREGHNLEKMYISGEFSRYE